MKGRTYHVDGVPVVARTARDAAFAYMRAHQLDKATLHVTCSETWSIRFDRDNGAYAVRKVE